MHGCITTKDTLLERARMRPSYFNPLATSAYIADYRFQSSTTHRRFARVPGKVSIHSEYVMKWNPAPLNLFQPVVLRAKEVLAFQSDPNEVECLLVSILDARNRILRAKFQSSEAGPNRLLFPFQSKVSIH